MKILLIEDDTKTASFISKGLEQAGFLSEISSDGEAGLDKALSGSYDAAVVDIMLPKLDGLTVIDSLRKKKIMTPVIVLSARRTVDDRIKGLQAGGDDYLVKPFAFSELLARINALIRRAGSVPEPTSLTVADLSIDLLVRKAFREGKEIQLQQLEFLLLEYLMRNAGIIVSKTMIMENVWGYNFDPHTNIVEVRVCNLRDKIDKPFDRKLIHNVKGVGYVLRKKDTNF